MALVISVTLYTLVTLAAIRRFIGHLAWQPDDDTKEVADKPDWPWAIKWGLIGGVFWWAILLRWLVERSWKTWPPHSPIMGRYELAARKQARELAHEKRCAELDVPIK